MSADLLIQFYVTKAYPSTRPLTSTDRWMARTFGTIPSMCSALKGAAQNTSEEGHRLQGGNINI